MAPRPESANWKIDAIDAGKSAHSMPRNRLFGPRIPTTLVLRTCVNGMPLACRVWSVEARRHQAGGIEEIPTGLATDQITVAATI
jgi:hypothetical protein